MTTKYTENPQEYDDQHTEPRLWKYRVTYKDKTYIYKAESAVDALEKFSDRKVFGSHFIFRWRLRMVDADTRGIEYADGITGDDVFFSAEKI